MIRGVAQCRGGIGSSPVPFPPDAVALLAEQGDCMMPYCLVRLLNSGIPGKGVSASVSALPALGPTPVVALTMPWLFGCLVLCTATRCWEYVWRGGQRVLHKRGKCYTRRFIFRDFVDFHDNVEIMLLLPTFSGSLSGFQALC